MNSIIEIKGRPARFIYGSYEKRFNIGRMLNEPEFTIIPLFIYRIWDGRKWKFLKTFKKIH